MSTTFPEKRNGGDVVFYEEDGIITAEHVQTGIARSGETHGDALIQLREVLTLETGDGEPINDEDAFFVVIGLDPEEIHEDRQENEGKTAPWE